MSAPGSTRAARRARVAQRSPATPYPYVAWRDPNAIGRPGSGESGGADGSVYATGRRPASAR